MVNNEKYLYDNWVYVAALLEWGSQKEACASLGISVQKMKNVLTAMYHRYGVGNFYELLVKAELIDFEKLDKLTLDTRTALSYNRIRQEDT